MALTRLGGANAITGIVPVANGGTGASSFSPGKVLQVVTATSTTRKETTGTSFVDTNLSASITPSATSSKIFMSCTQIIQVYNTGAAFAAGRWKIVQTIGGSDTAVIDGGESGGGNVFIYDYGNSGLNFYRPTNYSLLLSPSTTSAITFKTQICLGSNGGTQINAVDDKDKGSFVLMEVAG